MASTPVHNELLSRKLIRLHEALVANPADRDSWLYAQRALAEAEPDDPDLGESEAALAVELEDVEELGRLAAGWKSLDLDLPVSDKAILKRAMKAFRKRLKLTRLDDESRLGGNAMTDGRTSEISAVNPPQQYPQEIWDELVARGRMRRIEAGLYEAIS